MAKRKRNDLASAGIGMTRGAVILGIGADVSTKAGGSGAGMTTMSGYLPMIGSTYGAGMTIKQLKKLQKGKR